ncbi:amino acid adenylation domain-containing protein [Streptomyces sp. NPDC091268]|uniref:non-ribosomal peptide synthetase n=1 Tax=Streptomyces sp. NPDC091268 TaxID=3365979 RepID=UPI003812E302
MNPTGPMDPTQPMNAFAVTHAQQRIMIIEQLYPGGSAYHVPFAVRLRGALDRAAFTGAVREVVRRHESLRTVFRTVDGVLGQVVEQDHRLAVDVRDLTGAPPSEEELADLVSEAAARPFDLAGRLLRVELLRLAADDHVLAVTMHHLVSDSWSCGIFVGELAAAYRALAAGEAVDLPEPEVQYVDYAAWHRGQLDGARTEELLGYWRERLAGMPPVLQLPADRPRPAVQSFRGSTLPVRLSPQTSAAVKALARTLGASAFTTLLAAFQAAVGRWTGSEDITVSSGVANRTPQVEGLIGCFINVLLLRTSLAGDPSFAELTARVGRTVLDGVEHQDLPFDRLVEELAPKRDLSHQPLAQVMFLVQNAPMPDVRLGGLELSTVPVRRRATHLDLNVQLWDTGERFEGVVDYSTDLFDESTVRRMWTQYETLLAAAAARPEAPLRTLPLLRPEDEHVLVTEWNRTAAKVPDALTHELIEAQAARTPHAPAVVSQAGTLTYGELNESANRLARLLIERGAGPERTVALLLPRSAEIVTAVLAVLKSGSAYVPVDPAMPADRVAYVLADAAPSAVITTTAVPAATTGAAPRLDLDGADTRAALARCAASDPVDAERRAPLRADHLAYAIYTSGSTGRPKGVLISHLALADHLASCRRDYPGLGGSALLHSPVSVDLTVPSLLGPLAMGGRIVVGDLDGSMERLPRGAGRLSFLKITPSHLPILLGLPEEFSPTGDLVIGGEQLTAEMVEQWRRRFPGAVVTNEYGPTEATVGCVIRQIRPGDGPLAPGAVPIGRPVANSRAYVLDRSLRPVPVGVAGELYTAGTGLARGYHGRPGLTASAFLPDPFAGPGQRMYRTGDLARWSPDGTLDYLGRMDDQVKVRGFRIELGEIESALAALPGVEEVLVNPVRDTGDTTLAAYYVPAPGTAATVTELRAGLRRTLPDYMVPSHFVAMERIPLAVSGKADRKALPPVGGARPSLAAEHLAPRTPLESLLAEVWGSVLNVEGIGVRDDFFELGGYSLAATRIAALTADLFGVEIPLRDVFEATDVERQAALVEAAGREQGVDVPGIARLALEIGELSEADVDRLLAAQSG